jgi:hypothetical protein
MSRNSNIKHATACGQEKLNREMIFSLGRIPPEL